MLPLRAATHEWSLKTHDSKERPYVVLPLNICVLWKKKWSRVKDDLSEIPCPVSLDAHEWYNDLGTVSRICPVKIQGRGRCRLPAARRKDPGSFTAIWYWDYVW